MICCNKNAINFRKDAKHKITLQKHPDTPTFNRIGELIQTWEDLATVWAIIKPRSGKETFASEQLNSEVSGSMIIRYRADLKDTKETAKKRVIFDGRDYNILSVRNLDATLKLEGKDYQELLVKEEKI